MLVLEYQTVDAFRKVMYLFIACVAPYPTNPGARPVAGPAPALLGLALHHEGEGPRPAEGCRPQAGLALLPTARVYR